MGNSAGVTPSGVTPALLFSRGLLPEGDDVAAAANAAGWTTRCITPSTVPHQVDETPAYYGDTVTAAALVAAGGVVLLEPPFGVLADIDERFTRRALTTEILADAARRDAAAFVKPADPFAKTFSAAVREPSEIAALLDATPPETQVIVSEPVRWLCEYRAIVLERTILTWSCYRRGALFRPLGPIPRVAREATAVIDGCRRFLDDPGVVLPGAFVLDAGLIDGRGWAIVELNPVFSSRLFDCDRAAVLPALLRACRRPDRLPAGDAMFSAAARCGRGRQ